MAAARVQLSAAALERDEPDLCGLPVRGAHLRTRGQPAVDRRPAGLAGDRGPATAARLGGVPAAALHFRGIGASRQRSNARSVRARSRDAFRSDRPYPRSTAGDWPSGTRGALGDAGLDALKVAMN